MAARVRSLEVGEPVDEPFSRQSSDYNDPQLIGSLRPPKVPHKCHVRNGQTPLGGSGSALPRARIAWVKATKSAWALN